MNAVLFRFFFYFST
ncbi:pheST operon leader peptide PheM [Erwinia piriflorinigrans]|nr:pheST operon leader peptide PheM [Erwinia piriflorinigrans]